MATILIVEDNKNTQLLTAARLKAHFDVVCANDGLEALDVIYNRHIDMIVCDVMMPHMDGYELLRRLRGEKYEMPILLLTAKGAFEDKQEGFHSGTDDYMTKPVNYDELLLRIHALLRRARISVDRKIVIGSVVVDAASYTVLCDGASITLTKKEFDVLYKLLSYPGQIFTKNQLLDEVWGYDSDSTEDTVKTHINRLRGKFPSCADFEIVTVKGLGYKAEIRKAAQNG
ncbi:MAG: response regulator transcription factor [Oscillospiraceae bacterium]